MFSGPIYYHRTHGDGSHPSHGGYGADHLQQEETLSSQYSMKYGWSIIDDVKVSGMREAPSLGSMAMGWNLRMVPGSDKLGLRTGLRREALVPHNAASGIFVPYILLRGPEDYVRVVVGRFDACAADYLPAVLSRTRYSDRRSTIINVPSHTETADLCRIITWAKLSMGNNYDPAEEEEGCDDISGGAAEVADEIYNASPSTAEAADSKITKGPARSNTGRLRNLMDTLTDISIHDATPRREVDGGDVESVPGFELENSPVTKTSQDDGAGDISPSWHGSDSGGNSPKALPIFVIEEPTDEASADYGVAEEDASPISTTASEPRTPRKTIHLGPAEAASRPSVDPREETHMLALKAGKGLHMGLSLYR
ncbi:hypothetical protein FOZ60_005205 [Perkinsus olseni]|uniref:Uncharacterized protein n=2 Tax=Perkinsus olseni TaxID=32597 RepID=A0A7J6NRT4_PEROL|nr:hypothetical protein FOZ60_005205 [Perkinsus olseni]